MNKLHRNSYAKQSKEDFLHSLAEQNLKEFQVEVDNYQLDRFRKLSAVKKRGFLSSPLLSFWVSGEEYSDVKVADKIHIDNDSFTVKSVIIFKGHDLFLENARQYLLSDQLPLAQSWVLRRIANDESDQSVVVIRAFPTNRTVFKLISMWALYLFIAAFSAFIAFWIYMTKKNNLS